LEECLGRKSVLRKDREVRQYFAEFGARLVSDHTMHEFGQREREALDEILGHLLGTEEPGKPVDLTRHLDGMLSPDCPLGPRIIEFDEEQHFSSFRLVTLPVIQRTVEVAYDLELYRKYCCEPRYTERLLKKHRLRDPAWSRFLSTRALVDELARHQDALKGISYVRPTRQFPFFEGRIAQRAYYDCLRDFFHVSGAGKAMGLKPIISVSIYQVEELLGGPMDRAELQAVVDAVRAVLPS
jgi:hypothetical protein